MERGHPCPPERAARTVSCSLTSRSIRRTSAKPRTAKRPFSRKRAQAGPYRIILYIANGILKVFGVSNITVKVIFKPETSFCLKSIVRFLSGIRLERMHNFRERMRVARCRKQVYMVRHHDPCRQSVALAIKMKQSVLD